MRRLSIGAVAIGLIMVTLGATEAAARDQCDCGYFERPFTGRYWRGLPSGYYRPAYRYLAHARMHRVARSDAAMSAVRPAGQPVSPSAFGR